jgi:flagellar hook-associated protein 1 FlgK
LARVSDELRRTQSGGTAANCLLDSRDALLAALAERVRVTVNEAARGAVTVTLGSGGGYAVLVPGNGSAIRVGVCDIGAGPELIVDPTQGAVAVRLPASGSLSGLVEAQREVAATRLGQ